MFETRHADSYHRGTQTGDEKGRKAVQRGKDTKKVRIPLACGLSVLKVLLRGVPLSQSPGKFVSGKDQAGLLARESSSGRLPDLSTSGIQPFVIAYSGGSAGEWLILRAAPLFPIKPFRAP